MAKGTNRKLPDGPALDFEAQLWAVADKMRGHMDDAEYKLATAISIEREDLELSPFNQRGGVGKAHQLFGHDLNRILDELHLALVA
jgi:hypothetical protein